VYATSSLRRAAWLALCAVLAGTVVRATTAAAQTQTGVAAEGHAPVVTVNARLVVLDVVVTGKDGKPVDGLTEKDFQVFEDGVPQRIRSLEPPSAHALPAAAGTAGTAEVFDPATPANFGRSPAVVLVLDQLNTHFADSSFARRELRDYLTRQPALLAQPTTLLTVYDNRFQQLQGFTRDRDLLLKVLAAAPTKAAWYLEVGGNSDTDSGPVERLQQSLNALVQMAQSFARIPGRKNLVWVGGGFPTLNPTTLDGDHAQEVKDTIQHVTDLLLQTRITLYAVDPASNAAGLTEITNVDQTDFVTAGGGVMGINNDPFDSDEAFDRLGPVTGGRVIRGLNNVAELIASSVQLGADYYTLSYSPSSTAETAAKYRRIKVICLRPGLTTTTRSGYYAGKSELVTTKETASFDLSSAAEGRMPLNGLRVAAVAASGGLPRQYLVRVDAADLQWDPDAEGGSVASVYVLAAVFDKKGKMLAHAVHPMKATAKPGTDLRDPARRAGFAFTVPDAAKGAVVRFVVRDSSTGRMGSVEVPLP
jgi:VWFA-related protein